MLWHVYGKPCCRGVGVPPLQLSEGNMRREFGAKQNFKDLVCLTQNSKASSQLRKNKLC